AGLAVGGAAEGGGAVMAKGTRVTVINSLFSGNACVPAGADPGGAAVRVITTPIDEPNLFVNSTFEDGSCANGGAISGLHADFGVYNSLFTGNQATGEGQNHPDPNGGGDGVGLDGKPGGGLGGAVYMDGKWLGLTIAGSSFTANSANELGGALFFVDNGLTGDVSITDSTFDTNPATVQDVWGSTPGLYVQGVEGYPNQPLDGDEIGGVISNTTLN
ncbi:MAG: hypothetical protein S0880_32730, partial [Actinomycetota bacterium]|nr:hypothetical protein [Actinomycetota bacterium]